VIYIPPNTIHQHFNAASDRPVRLVSAINRIYKYCGLKRPGADRGRSRVRCRSCSAPKLVEENT